MSKTIAYIDAYSLSNTFQDEVQNIWRHIDEIDKVSNSNSRKAWRQRKRAVQRKPYGKHGVRKYTK